MIDSVTIGGKVYAAPLMASWTIMFYNSRDVPEGGPGPEQAARHVGRAGRLRQEDAEPRTPTRTRIPWPRASTSSCAFFRWAKSAGAKISEWRGNKVYWLLDSPECVQALDFLKKMMKEGTMDPGTPTYMQQQIADLFGKGHASMFVNWDMMQIAFKNPEQTPFAGKIFAANMPGAKAGLTGSIEGHEYLAVPGPSKHKEAAKKFIKFLQTPEVQKKRAVEEGMTPVLKDLFKDADVKKVINLDVVFKAAANCYYRPAIAEYTQCSDIISAEIQNALVNNKDTKQALKDANDKCNKLSGLVSPSCSSIVRGALRRAPLLPTRSGRDAAGPRMSLSSRLEHNEGLFAFLLVLPAMLIVLALYVYPLVFSLVVSFFRSDIRYPG